ncbi:hypothetical protein D3C83_193760 [compost metagenome]
MRVPSFDQYASMPGSLKTTRFVWSSTTVTVRLTPFPLGWSRSEAYARKRPSGEIRA